MLLKKHLNLTQTHTHTHTNQPQRTQNTNETKTKNKNTGNSQQLNTFDIEDDAPPGYIDGLFFLWIILIHIYYAYKFTDYSLDHIHRQLTEIEEAEGHIEKSQRSQLHHMGSDLGLGSPQGNNSGGGIGAHQSQESAIVGNEFVAASGVSHQASMHLGGGYAFVKTKSGEQVTSQSSLVSSSHTNVIATIPSKTGTNNNNNNTNGNESGPNIIMGTGNTATEMQLIANANAVSTPVTNNEAANELGLGSVDDNMDENGNEMNNNNNNITSGSNTNDNTNNNSENEDATDAVGRQWSDREDSTASQSQRLKEQMLLELEDAKIEIKVDYVTLARPLTGLPNTKCCCLFPWSHVFFSWSRTYAVRFFLRVYVLLACSLALVLWIEIFANTILEVCYLFFICYFLFVFISFALHYISFRFVSFVFLFPSRVHFSLFGRFFSL